MDIYSLIIRLLIAALVLLLTLGIGHSKWKKHEVMHPVNWFVQYFLAALLLLSGFVKAIDPLGTAYKMQDYFVQFSLQGLPLMYDAANPEAFSLYNYALPFSLGMLVLELVLGLCLLMGVGKLKTTLPTFLMMIFFTILTGFNYLTGYTPEDVGLFEFDKWVEFDNINIRIKDCGCFGDFIKLKPIETFTKDIVFTGLSLFLLLFPNKLKELISPDAKLGKLSMTTLFALVATAVSTAFCFANFYWDKPMIDFRPYAEGINVFEARDQCLADAPVKEISYLYLHKEDSTKIRVKMNDLGNSPFLWNDTLDNGKKAWESIKDSIQEKTIKEGCNSSVQFFSFPEIEESEGYSFLIVSADIEHADKEAFKQIAAISNAAKAKGINSYGAYHDHGAFNYEDFKKEIGSNEEYNNALDDKMLKAIIRANPGLLLMKKGMVIKKWHHRHIPTFESIENNYLQ